MTLTIDKIIIKDKVKCEQKAKLYIKFINHFLKLNEINFTHNYSDLTPLYGLGNN